MTYNKIKKTKTGVLLVAGIVSPQPIVEQINQYANSLQTLFSRIIIPSNSRIYD